VLGREIGPAVVDDPAVERLPTIAGVNATVAAGPVAATGDVRRFPSPQELASYFGPNPRVRQPGPGLAQHGRIGRTGRAHARALLVEAARAAAEAPGPSHASFVRIRARRGHQVAAVAAARRMAVPVRHPLAREADRLWARPAPVARKVRALELQAGRPAKKGDRRGAAYAYDVKELRDREEATAGQAERAHERLVAQRRRKPGERRTGAATAAGSSG
jgi:hypothetical protein